MQYSVPKMTRGRILHIARHRHKRVFQHSERNVRILDLMPLQLARDAKTGWTLSLHPTRYFVSL